MDIHANSYRGRIIVNWRIYYAGGITFSSEDGDPAASPILPVLCIIQRDEDHNRVILTWNLYYWNPQAGMWFGADSPGDIADRVMFGLPTEAARKGATVTAAEMRETLTRAHRDPDFPRQTGPARVETPKYLEWTRDFLWGRKK